MDEDDIGAPLKPNAIQILELITFNKNSQYIMLIVLWDKPKMY